MPKRDRASLFATITDGLTDMAQEDILQVPLSKLTPGKSQPRKYFDTEALAALAQSVSEQGVLQPLLVRPNGEGYEIIAGERRYRAAKLAGRDSVPVLVRELADRDAFAFALIENLQREDLNPVEETEALLGLYALKTGVPIDEAGSHLQTLYFAVTRGEAMPDVAEVETFFTEFGSMNWKSFVNHRLPLLKLPEDVLNVLRAGKIEYTKAREIARLKDTETRADLLEMLMRENLSLQELKSRIRDLRALPDPAEPTVLSRVVNLRTLARKSQALQEPTTRRKVETLLSQLEALLQKED
jgi:ParB family chromosome partitioning protein